MNKYVKFFPAKSGSANSKSSRILPNNKYEKEVVSLKNTKYRILSISKGKGKIKTVDFYGPHLIDKPTEVVLEEI